MAGLTAANSIADALRTQAVMGVVEALFRNNEVMNEFPVRPFTGGSTINRKMHYAGNTSVGTYDEGDAIGAPGSQSYLTALWPEKHYKVVIQITGHARDYLRDGSAEAAFFDQISMETEKAFQDLVHAVSLDMLGAGTTAPIGIQGIVDSAGTVAGINRSTYTWFQSYESAGSSIVISTTDLNSAMYQSQDSTYAGQVNEIWTSWKQMYKYRESIGNAGVANGPVRVMMPNGAGELALNAGAVTDRAFLGPNEIKPKRNLTNSIWLGLTKPDFFIGKMREWKVDQLAKVDDSDKFLITGSFGLGCDNPKRSWKLTGYTA